MSVAKQPVEHALPPRPYEDSSCTTNTNQPESVAVDGGKDQAFCALPAWRDVPLRHMLAGSMTNPDGRICHAQGRADL